jgi:hypothetical protein
MTGTGMTDLNQFKTFQGHFTDQGYKMTFLLKGATVIFFLHILCFLSNGNSLNIDFQGTEGLSRNLVSTLLPNFN